MTERDEDLLRQLFFVPGCPTPAEVWLKWRDLGHSGTIKEVSETLWSMPEELWIYRDFCPENVDIESRKQYLQDLEASLIGAWQMIRKRSLSIPLLEGKLSELLSLTQRHLRDVAIQAGAV